MWEPELQAHRRFARRFDYLARDALHCGVKTSCDFDRIMRFSKASIDRVREDRDYLTVPSD